MKIRSNNILCTDCNENYISEERYDKYGVCLSCQRRKRLAETKHREYIPYKYLEQSEKDRISENRSKHMEWIETHKKKLFQNNDEIQEIKIGRGNKIYTDEIIDEIKAMADNNIKASELREIVKIKHPELNITTSNFNNIIRRYNIPHKTCKKNKVTDVEEQVILNPANILKSKDDKIDLEDSIIKQGVDTGVIIRQDFTNKTSSIDEDGDPIRLKPIKEEVVTVLDGKFEEKNCKNEFNYSVKDYINMLEMFEYLAKNIDDLIRYRDLQFNILNAYQFDILHEMENELASDGDTYLQDKMYVVRDYRRYMEIDYKALKQLRAIVKLMRSAVHPDNPNNPTDIKSMCGCISSLKQIISENAQPKFVPRVDIDMVKKYDWAITKNSNYKKEVTQDKSIKSNAKIQDKSIEANMSLRKIKSNIKLTEEQVRAGLCVFRVSCKMSGDGIGLFRPWYKDYACVASDIAVSYAQQEFTRLQNANKSLLITEIECHKLNII